MSEKKSKSAKKKIDVNAKAESDGGIFGLPFSENESKVVYLPIPWDVTTSYKPGTHKGPLEILKASSQIDFFDWDFVDAFEAGLYMRPVSSKIKLLNKKMRPFAEKIINASEDQLKKSKALQATLKKVNSACDELNSWVYEETKALLQKGKMPVLVGGDHATPLGAIQAYSEKYKGLGILHFDAHSDTRVAYMGLKNSHASILYNVSQTCPQISKIVQVGIRDFCEQEFLYTTHPNSKFKVFFDHDLKNMHFAGKPFKKVAEEIVSHLPQEVYVTIDIDALDPRFCPNTGTPVPGGLEYNELIEIVKQVVSAGKKIVGFDLVEVGVDKKGLDDWDANVGMRVLYKMTSLALGSQGLIEAR